MNAQSIPHRVAQYDKTEFGFWLYLMTDIILFASLFATYMVLRPNVAGGPSSADILDPSYALLETILLLTSSFTCGVAVLALRYKKVTISLMALAMTLLFGLAFIGMELNEFIQLANEGHSWQQSAFLSGFFTLVATHGLHISIGIVWGILMTYLVYRKGSTAHTLRKMTLFSLFWHFLDLVWIFIFTIVYLGASL